MTLFEERYDKACNDGLITHYEYKRHVNEGKISKYNDTFLKELPDFYFIGLPIKKIITEKYSNGLCHALSLAVGLCFDDYEIVTANLDLYKEFYNKNTLSYNIEYEHSYVIVPVNGIKMVIDPVFGIIADIDTYEKTFGSERKSVLKKLELEKVPAIRTILSHIHEKSPLLRGDVTMEDFDKYYEYFEKYVNECTNYSNPADFKLEYFIRKCLKPTSDEEIINNLTETLMNEIDVESYSDSEQLDKTDTYKN